LNSLFGGSFFGTNTLDSVNFLQTPQFFLWIVFTYQNGVCKIKTLESRDLKRKRSAVLIKYYKCRCAKKSSSSNQIGYIKLTPLP